MTGNWVKRPHFVHVREVNNDFVLDRNTPSNETRVSALGTDADFAVVAPFDDLADLLGGLGLQNGGRVALETTNPIRVELVELVRCCRCRGKRGDNGCWG